MRKVPGIAKASRGALTPLALALAAGLWGCSSGGSSAANPSSGGSSDGQTSLNFRVDNFTADQVATLVKRNTPANEGGSNSQALSAVGKEEGMRDLPPELLKREEEIRSRMLAPEELRPRVDGPFDGTPEGTTYPFFIVTTNASVTCRKMHEDNETVHCTILAEQPGGTPVINKAQALAIAEIFDNNNPFKAGTGDGIYDQVRGIFGSEWTNGGGRDGSSKVNLVILSNGSIGNGFFGFFRPLDEFARTGSNNSNEGEIVYLNVSKLSGDGFDFYSTLAHEFQHLVSFNVKEARQGSFTGQSENAAIDEGKSVLCEDLCGFGLDASGGGNGFIFRTCDAFLDNPHRQGIFQFDTGSDGYGRGYTLMRYLVDRFGLPAFASYTQANGRGLAQLEASYGDFRSIFNDWTMANLASSLVGSVPNIWRYTSAYQPRGTYTVRGFVGPQQLPGWTPQQTVVPPSGNQSVSLPPWSAASVEYRGGNGSALDVNLSGPQSISGNMVLERPRGSFNGVR
jgi:hypothetical protein